MFEALSNNDFAKITSELNKSLEERLYGGHKVTLYDVYAKLGFEPDLYSPDIRFELEHTYWILDDEENVIKFVRPGGDGIIDFSSINWDSD